MSYQSEQMHLRGLFGKRASVLGSIKNPWLNKPYRSLAGVAPVPLLRSSRLYRLDTRPLVVSQTLVKPPGYQYNDKKMNEFAMRLAEERHWQKVSGYAAKKLPTLDWLKNPSPI